MPSAVPPPLTPLSDDELASRSPFLSKLSRRRLAPVRLAELYSKARCGTPPKEPEPWECCGSSCKPCVRELWKEEKRVWDECHPDGPDDDDDEEKRERSDDDDEERLDRGLPSVEIGIEARVSAIEIVETVPARAVTDETPHVVMEEKSVAES